MATSVYAHQQKIAYTTVLFNPNTSNIEVMHRFNLHDAEHAVKQIFGKDADILALKSTRETFSQYVANNFSVLSAPDKIEPLEKIGYEVDGKYIWIYQETPISNNISSLTITHNVLRDVWPRQVNRVNIEVNGSVTTLVFSGVIQSQTASINTQ